MPETPSDGTKIQITTRYDRVKERYFVSLDVGDRMMIINRDKALRWAQEIMAMVAQAEHDAAVLAQLRALHIANDASAYFVDTLRKKRPSLVHTFTNLQLLPGVSAFTGQAFFNVLYQGQSIGQMGPDQARQQAMDILEVVQGADLDTAYLKELAKLDIPENTGLALVRDLSTFRPQEHE